VAWWLPNRWRFAGRDGHGTGKLVMKINFVVMVGLNVDDFIVSVHLTITLCHGNHAS